MSPSRFSPARVAVPTVVSALVVAATVVVAVPAQAAVSPTMTRLVAAGSAVRDATGAAWLPDAGTALGGKLTRTPALVKGSDAALYASARSGVTGYHIPVTGQTNLVTLGFVEQQRAATPGQRTFRVVAEGSRVVANVDTAAAVGTLRAYRVSFAVQVTDGFLDLSFARETGVPSIANLQILSSGSPSPALGNSAAPPAASGSPESFGAKGDGVTDDTAALQRAFDDTPVGQAVVLTAGRTYAHSGVLHLRKRWLHLTGSGTLLATSEATSSVWIEADNVLVDGGVDFTTASTTRRWDAWEQMGVRVVGTTGTVLRSVTVDGSAAAGIYVGNGARNFLLDHVTVQNTRADGIHMTEGANWGLVLSPTVRNSGDDGIAVVSYLQDGAPCHDISVVSPTVLGTSWGRGLSVVGGSRITETNIDVRNTSAAAVYIASEGNPWFTAAPSHVVVSGGSITGANTDTDVDHGAVLVLSGEQGTVPNSVTVRNVAITGTRASASRNLGVITYGDTPTGVVFSGIAITGGPAAAYQGNTPTSAYQLLGVTHDGVSVPVGG